MSLQTKVIGLSVVLILVPLSVLATLVVSYLQSDKEAFIQLLGTESTPVVASEVEANVASLVSELTDLGELATAPYLGARARENTSRTLFSRSAFLAVRVRQGEETLLSLRASETRLGPEADVILPSLTATAGPLSPGATTVENVTRLPDRPMARIRISRRLTVGMVEVEGLIGTDAIFEASRASTLDTWVVDSNDQVLVALDRDRVAALEDASALAPIRALREGRRGSVAYARGNEDRIGSYAQTALGGLGVVQDLPTASIDHAVAALGRQVALASVVAIVLALLLAFVVARSVSRPIALLAGIAEQIGEGKLDEEIPRVGGAELRVLSLAFSRMQQGLAERDRRLREAQEALVHSEKMGALGQLAAGITHEVKNPLAGILGYAQLAQKAASPGSVVESHLKIIEEESKRATEILKNLLSFARRETGELEPIDPNEIVAESIKLVAHPLQLARVQLAVGRTEGLPEVMADLASLQQVLMNLCMNAADAMKPKGGRLEVTASLAPDGRVVIAVKDEGHGIDEASRKKLFTPFFTTKPKGEGTGLGLSISYGIVQAHQGELRVWSQVGVGTIFYIYLPPKDRFRAESDPA